ncbi:zinc finger MYM-type protein 1-like [Myzus persicae]|uniref:zinc finger MYM-type protein 1-like n=1 Tax=Myzus persicae TaxID=13164 RepID=UPI000B93967A|nr:zinc finger MYM-type protein 1-like [Myzus persicae]
MIAALHLMLIHTQLSNAHKQQIADNRHYIKTITDIILYLARQGLAFRGHDERLCSNNQGNFKEACKLFAKHNPQFSNYYNNTINYGSWLIQNDIANICAQHVKNSIIDEVKSCNMYSIMCDEARSFKEEYMAFCIRYPNGLCVEERFLGFIKVSENQNAESLTSAIFSFIE